ncbi:MAG TPA: tRNA (N(6)-L-threonylcarbamoyladenosine(37)-C(2))-methylthiotransferase MtaB [Terriglobales bacterium]|nr:tRNA (N(6)-L-threonylcarbamoyladenosine(37)-C(2))-methylthiotransferase MtaB [Terriglobales bacterium]
MASFYVENFGCRATQADGAAIERQFEQHGLERASGPAKSEIVVLNTCTVTASADQDARATIRRIRRENPDCQIVVTGCYAQRAPEEVASLPGVTRVIGNSHKHQLAEIVVSRRHDSKSTAAYPSFVPLSSLAPRVQSEIFVSDIFAHTELLAAPVFDAAGPGTNNERTRPNLKVQDGCDNRCSFCVIPYVRGQSRSLALDRILNQLHALVNAGYREVVISGINLGRWGRDFDRPSRFETLVREILRQSDLEKLRISSVEPMDWSDELIRMMAASPRIAKHAHVPLQSGSDRVLRAMHRKYRPWHYREKLERIRAAMPTAAIGADVMVGFPGESDADFEETRRMIEELPFTYLHVFTYSSRPGTPAAAKRDQVPVQIARERNRILRDLAGEKKLAFMRAFVGKTVEAITLNVFDGNSTEALTDNYLKLRLQGQHQTNQWITAQVETVEGGALTATSPAVL